VRDPRTVSLVRTHAIQVPNDPTARAHLAYRVLRLLAVPARSDSPKAHWLAIGAVNLRGAPRMRYGTSGDTMMRRVVWALWMADDGYLPAGWVVRACCGVERCCRPDHLELVRGAVSHGTIAKEYRGVVAVQAAVAS
jgi:hypothetical protein